MTWAAPGTGTATRAPGSTSTSSTTRSPSPPSEWRQAARESGFGVPVAAATRSIFEVSAQERNVILEAAWNSGSLTNLGNCYFDTRTTVQANDLLRDFIHGKIRELVKDPRTADDLCPQYPVGTKRPCLDTGYYDAFNRDNVHLVSLRRTPLLSNMMVSIEQHVDWVADAIAHLDGTGLAAIEPTREAQDAWVEHVNEVASLTLFPKANSWYLGANVPGKPRVFMPYAGGVGNYRARCDEVARNGYQGFTLTA